MKSACLQIQRKHIYLHRILLLYRNYKDFNIYFYFINSNPRLSQVINKKSKDQNQLKNLKTIFLPNIINFIQKALISHFLQFFIILLYVLLHYYIENHSFPESLKKKSLSFFKIIHPKCELDDFILHKLPVFTKYLYKSIIS